MRISSFSAPLSSPPPKRRAKAAFTLAELVIAIALTVLGAVVLVVFSESTGKTLISLSAQSEHNQSVANAVEFMLSRIRAANTASLDVAGTTLTLGYDDDITFDSDADGFTWNDQDHFEQFQVVSGDPSMATLDDNKIVYISTNALTTNGVSRDLVPRSTRTLLGQPIFSLANSNSTVLINFGLLATNSTPFSQQIEIRTKALMRNRTK